MCGEIESLPGPNHTFPEIQYLCKQRGISMYNQNIRNLSTNYESLCKILSSHRGMDIISLSETQTNEDNEKLFAIQGYDYFVRSRINGDGGGVTFYIKPRLK